MDWFFEIIYQILDKPICWFVSILYSFFEVFAGLKKVEFKDGGSTTYDYLINIFFSNSSINTIYWGMALIGIALCFGFTIMAVIKKIFDIDDKMKGSLGSILTSLLKSILSILLVNFLVISMLNATNILMQQVVKLFDNSNIINDGDQIVFDDSDYATMARILNTIGNYSLNPSRDSKYNINSCFNEIRNDMLTLQRKGVFKYSYQDYDKTIDSNGEVKIKLKETKPTWQSSLLAIARAQSLDQPQPIDVYNKRLTEAIVDCMKNMERNKDFVPLTSYQVYPEKIKPEDTPIDAIIFLSGTLNAAQNEAFNKNPSIFDSLRYEYIRPGGKSIYDGDDIDEDFDYGEMSHLTIILIGILVLNLFLSLCVNCIARIFNMLLLYVMAPPFIATAPFDEGEKTKQWWTAFIIQTFSVFGSVIGIRLLMIFVPIIFNSDLVLFESSILNFMGKIIMMVAVAVAVDQASKLVTGILANNAGMQSLYAADVGGAGANILKGMGKGALGGLGTVGKGLLRATYAQNRLNALKSGLKNSSFGTYLGYGKGSEAGMDKAREKAEDKAERQKEREEEAKKSQESGGSGSKATSSPIQISQQGGFSISSQGGGGTGGSGNVPQKSSSSSIQPSSQSSISIAKQPPASLNNQSKK